MTMEFNLFDKFPSFAELSLFFGQLLFDAEFAVHR